MDVPAPPSVPGFVLETLVRFSQAGETWLARCHSLGELVSLTLVQGALVSSAEPLTVLRHPHVVPVTEVVAAGRSVALVSPVPAPLTLASLCAGRPVFDPGEVVTLGVPLARALAAAHDRGIVHGDLDPVDIVIDASGQPALTGLGVAGLSGAGVAPADDVHALAMILRSLLGDDAGPRAEAIRGALGSALSGHPAARPEAGELAGTLSLCCPPQPIRGLPADEPTHPIPAFRGQAGRHGLPRRLHLSSTAVTAGLAVTGLVLLVLAAPLFGGGHHEAARQVAQPVAAPFAAQPSAAVPTPVPTPPPTPLKPTVLTPTQWQHTLQRLADARNRAFVQLDPAAVVAADAPGSSAAAIDAGRVATLRSAKVHATGLSSTITGVTVSSSGDQAASLSFEESTRAYDLVTSDGVVVQHRPAEPKKRWSVTLVNSAAGWRTATATAPQGTS